MPYRLASALAGLIIWLAGIVFGLVWANDGPLPAAAGATLAASLALIALYITSKED